MRDASLDTNDAFRWTREVALCVLEEIEAELRNFDGTPFRYIGSPVDAAFMDGCYEADEAWRSAISDRFAAWRTRLWGEITEIDEKADGLAIMQEHVK